MIYIKNSKEIEIMRTGGKILADVLNFVMDAVKPGVSELEIDKLAEKMIREKGGEPGFMKVDGYHHTICVSTNDAVVHGIPTSYKFKEGDVVGIDCGVFYKGFHTDMSDTKIVESDKFKADSAVTKFLEVGKDALRAGIAQVKPGNRVGHVSKAIQDIVERQNGYSIVRSLVGHGVGKELHEEPEVPGFIRGSIQGTPLLKEGMVIAVEVIYNIGEPGVVYADDGWTIKTADGSISGLYERTVAIASNGHQILTA